MKAFAESCEQNPGKGQKKGQGSEDSSGSESGSQSEGKATDYWHHASWMLHHLKSVQCYITQNLYNLISLN